MPKIVTLLLALACGAASAAPLRLSAGASTLVLTGIQPAGTQVVWFSVARSSDGLVAWTHNLSDLPWDDSADGILPIDRGAPPPAKFLTAAVELASGRFAILSRPDGPIRISPAAMDSVGQSPPRPAELRAADVGLWVAPRPLEDSALRIGGADSGAPVKTRYSGERRR